MDQTFVLFSHLGTRYGLDVRAVREIVWLPALSPIEELPPHIVGVFNLHGRVIPVIDLCQRFGHARQPYRVSDRLIVIESEGARVGLIVTELHDLVTLEASSITPASSYQGAGGEARFVLGEVRTGADLAMLLDIHALLQSASLEQELASALQAELPPRLPELFGRLDIGEAELVCQRAALLAQPLQSAEGELGQAYAVIRLEGELFGLSLDLVREFSGLRAVTPVPCCPPHILGNMNLRGDILTIADIRPALGLGSQATLEQVAVLQVGVLRFGVPVSEVIDVVHIAAQDRVNPPANAVRAMKAYCSATTLVNGQTLALLDLERIVEARELHVAHELL